MAGSVLVGYALLGVPLDYLLAAAFMTAPSGLLMAKMVVPETGDATLTDNPPEREGGPSAEEGAPDDPQPPRRGEQGDNPGHGTGPLSRCGGTGDRRAGQGRPAGPRADGARGWGGAPADQRVRRRRPWAEEGLRVAATVGALLIAFISLIALLNVILGAGGDLVGLEDLTFRKLLGYVFAPVAFVIGVPWSEAVTAGSFLGEKLIPNEFVAFTDFGPRIEELSDKTVAVVTFALCGFANFGSFAILLGGLANLLNAAVAGMFV